MYRQKETGRRERGIEGEQERRRGGGSHTHTHARTHARTRARARTYARTHARTRAHARTHTPTHTCARERTHAHAHAYAYAQRETDRRDRVRDRERSSNDAVSSYVDAVQLLKQCINKNLFLLPYNASLYVDRHSFTAEKELKTHVSFDRQQCFLLWPLTTFG